MTISALCATGAVDQDFDGPHGLAGPPLTDFPTTFSRWFQKGA
jgi:hypothetical protein